MIQQTAKYQEVIDWIRGEIEDGRLQPGDKLLSEMELAEKFSLSRQTIRHATGILVSDGTLTAVRGSGTYVGSAAAKLPAREKYHNIAVISTYLDSYIFPSTLRGIESVLSASGYTTQIAFTDNQVAREETALRGILEKDNIDGLVVEAAKSSLPNPNLALYKKITSRGIPILFFNTYYSELELPCVRLDDFQCAREMTELLITRGHKRIGAILHAEDGQGRLRYAGFLKAMRESGLAVDQRCICWIDTEDFWHLEELGSHLLARLKGCTGLLCYNDEIANQVIPLLHQAGIEVPRDISLVSIDDSTLSSLGTVPFASCSHPKEELGRKTAENLLRMIEDPAFDGNYLFPCEPVVRDSIRSLRLYRDAV